ncbi:hypothetical protein [Arthrobacter sulfonylureivorans]|uniref:Uncharacterized protein n=1 Tax=Arthrobacter sulfonylureivorans TaxID=2486855 RepID=A0ABY3WGE8_9MICC|nr:hypothetical protein [Arthrobacter sulfonylureivorans]UNK47431.1 hypothetical protein MNQ99_08920 [Arthrobacter sulfonylureivorans]
MSERELDFVHSGVLVQYKRRAAKLDRRHLIVMFAGVGRLDSYEFDGRASSDSQAHWLWIKDKFDGQHAYYLCRNMDFSIERAVVALIEAELQRLGLSRKECTLAGFSKGGFAALYLGIKYNFGNILASAPQIYAGTHTRGNRPKIFAHLTGGGGQAELESLDGLLPDAVAADEQTEKNIYLFSSPRDQFHAGQIVPALPMFAKYPNFNYIETDSDLVNEHTDVTRYNVPLILATLYALAENVAPRYGTVRNGDRMPSQLRSEVLARQREAGNAVANLTGVRLSGSVFFPEGVGFLRGHATEDWADLASTLVLAGEASRHEFALGGNEDAGTSFRYFQQAYCNYRLARFSSRKHQGIDLAGLPAGTYDLRLRLMAPDREAEQPLATGTPLSTESQRDGRLYRFRTRPGGAVLDVRPVLGTAPQEAYFRLRTSWARGQRVHLDGDFAVRGVEVPDSKAARYYLVLHGPAGTQAFALAAGGFRGDTNVFGDGLSDYSGAHFGTRKGAGVDISALPPGTYHAAVSLSCAGGLYTLPTGKTVQIRTADAGTTAAMHDTAPGPASFRSGIVRLAPSALRRRIKRRLARR